MPGGYTARAAARGDLEAVAGLIAACDLEDFGFEEYTAQDLADAWDGVRFDLETRTVLVAGPRGKPAAYGHFWEKVPGSLVVAVGEVHPAHRGRGLGGYLVGEIEARGLALASGPVTIHHQVAARDRAGRALMDARGYELVRHFWRMERALDGTESPPAPPDGIEVRAPDPERDARAAYDVMEEAFADHWGRVEIPFDEWRQAFMGHEGFDPALWFLALDRAEPVGVLIGRSYPDEGWVRGLGVRKAWRGRGIARCLLGRAFAAFARRGLREVGLMVDAGNETGATRLYESVGMRPALQVDYWEKTLTG